VNDRLCDCCDGSDEFASGATCPNTCNAAADREGREAKAREERRVAGIKARLQLVETAKLRRADIKIQLKQESDNLAELENAVAAREAEKKVCEAEELSERQEIKKKSEADMRFGSCSEAEQTVLTALPRSQKRHQLLKLLSRTSFVQSGDKHEIVVVMAIVSRKTTRTART
jgi:protein kinase C substrate 80K-H